MKYDVFNNPEIWCNGFYELSMEYHPSGNNKRLEGALSALCKCELFSGLWEEKKDLYQDTLTLPITIKDVNQMYGVLSLSSGEEFPCMVSVIRVEGESDWLDIAIPQAFFEKYYPYQYPLTRRLNPWLEKVDETYTKLAEFIFGESPFDFAMIGEEISGYTNLQELTGDTLKNMITILPVQLQERLGVRKQGRQLSNGLRVI